MKKQKTIEFTGFLVGPKSITEFPLDDKNLRKVNCCYREDGRLVNSEGFWAWLSKEDAAKYDKDESGEMVVVAANHTLNGIPWGAYFPVRSQGSSRPVCVINEMIDTKTKVVFHSKIIADREKAAKEQTTA